ncbi:YhcN/YlaJ family sporulation lipoprotein [Robertmurraya sp. P23]|uniref:YhcN/YlaJ family sporulation lipoprotein n=1 Tax=Robertmurraya sp. P23 TaxID=3436931 RepID=UPI003D996B0A
MNRFMLFLVVTVLSFFLTGCGFIINHANETEDQQAQISQAKARILNDETEKVDPTIRVSQLAEQYVEKLEEVERANVIYSNNNAYVAIKPNQYDSLSEVLDQKIADQVRKADNKIHKVYVSVNPDFYATMNSYAHDIRSGRDKVSLYRDFSNTVMNFFGIESE